MDHREFTPLEPETLFYRPATGDDLTVIAEIESNSYPPDEAASPENLRYRVENAGDYFLVGCSASSGPGGADEIVSYVCGTLIKGETLTHESMSTHDADGDTLCIHSVVTEGGHRRKQIGTKTLKAYMRWITTATPQVERVLLLCKRNLIGFYEGAGWKMVGESDVVHGKDQWYEMEQSAARFRALVASTEQD